MRSTNPPARVVTRAKRCEQVKTSLSKSVFFVVLSLSVALIPSLAGAQQVSITPSSVDFGSVSVGNSKSQVVVVKNITKRRIGIYQASVSGTGYTISGISTPVSIQIGQSASFTVTFTPPSAATDSGTVSLVTQNWWKDHRTGPVTSQLTMSGTGASSGQLTANPGSVAFGNVMVGDTKTSPASLTNSGSATVNISQAALSNAAYSVSGLNPPVTLTAGQSLTFNIIFAPASGGASSGALAITSNAADSQLNVNLSGSGTTPGQLALAPSTYNFGNVDTGKSAVMSGTLTAAGSQITLSSASSTSSEFVLSGVTFPVTLANGQSVPFAVTFVPQASGAASGSVSFVSTATNSPNAEALSGTGVAPIQHSVDLNWQASGTPGVVGYCVYRGTVSGGPYQEITTSPDPGLSYSDGTVQSGQTYYYVVTAEDNSGLESGHSNEVPVTVPTP